MKGRVLSWIAVLCLSSGVLAGEMQRDTKNFSFLFSPREERAALSLAQVAEKHRESLCRLFPRCVEGPIVVRVAGALDEFLEQLPYPAHIDWASGVAISSQKLILLRTDAQNLFSLEETFVHELSHILLLHPIPHRPPRWFIEGVAIHQAGENLLHRFHSLSGAALGDRMIPLKDLEQHFPREASGRHLAYAQSGYFVSYLVRRFGEDPLREFIGRLFDGIPFSQAFLDTYQDSLVSLEKQWKDSFQKTAWVHALTSDLFVWSVLSAIFVGALLLGWYQRRKRRALLAASEHGRHRGDDRDWEYR